MSDLVKRSDVLEAVTEFYRGTLDAGVRERTRDSLIWHLENALPAAPRSPVDEAARKLAENIIDGGDWIERLDAASAYLRARDAEKGGGDE